MDTNVKRGLNLLNPIDYANYAFEMHRLSLAASETIWHRSMQMTMGKMSALENASMWTEKPTALIGSMEKATIAAVAGKPPVQIMQAAMEQLTKKASSNAKRLRK